MKKAARKIEKKHKKKKRRNSLRRTIRKIHPERKKIQREEQNTVSRYPVKGHYCTYSDSTGIKLCKF